MSRTSGQARSWAIRLPSSAIGEACALRLAAGVEIARDGEQFWLRGPDADENLRRRLLGLPALARFEWRSDGRLRPLDSLLATARMPELTWESFKAWARPELPSARLPAPPPSRLPLQLVSATSANGAARPALLLEFAAWRDWALHAPLARLEPLSFALSGRLALVRGAPAPAAPGRHLADIEGVLIPAGLRWEPAVSVSTLRRVCGAAPGNVLWWDERGLRVLGEELFVPATRANVRASARALAEAAPE